MAKSVLIFLGGSFSEDLQRVEQVLPKKLSGRYKIICFEFPQFKRMLKIISGKYPLLEKINKNLIIFHSFGLFPWGRNFRLINKINHIFNFWLLRHLKKDFESEFLLSFTPESVFLLNDGHRFKKVIYYAIDDYVSLPFWQNFMASPALLSR